MFKLWSETNKDAKEKLKPDLGFRGWDDLSDEEKEIIWQHFDFITIGDRYCISETIRFFNENYRSQNLTPNFLKVQSNFMSEQYHQAALIDFADIFMKQEEYIVMQLLSVYAQRSYEEKIKNNHRIEEEKKKEENEIEEEEKVMKKEIDEGMTDEEKDELIRKKEQLQIRSYKRARRKGVLSHSFGPSVYSFDTFVEKTNNIFLQFGVKYYLTEESFVPRQEEKIVKEVYEPVLAYLRDEKWKKVSENLSDAFADYRKNTPQGYSGCVTKTVSAVQAFLQILVRGGTGKGDIAELVNEAVEKELIPNDVFTQTIFKNVQSIFSRERQKTSDAHPKDEYANEKSARMILNLAMVFIQYCMQK